MKSFVECLYELQLNPNKNFWLFDLALFVFIVVTVLARGIDPMLGDFGQLWHGVDQKIKASIKSGWPSLCLAANSKYLEDVQYLKNQVTIFTHNLTGGVCYSLHSCITRCKKHLACVCFFFQKKYALYRKDLSEMKCYRGVLVGLASQYVYEAKSHLIRVYPSLCNAAKGWIFFLEAMSTCTNKLQDVLSALFVQSPPSERK